MHDTKIQLDYTSNEHWNVYIKNIVFDTIQYLNMQDTTPKHYVLNVKQHPDELTSIQLALHSPPTVQEAKIKTVRINVSVILRWTNPSTCVSYFDRESKHKCQTRLYKDKMQPTEIKSHLNLHFLVNFRGGFPKNPPFYQDERCLNMFPFPRLLVDSPLWAKVPRCSHHRLSGVM